MLLQQGCVPCLWGPVGWWEKEEFLRMRFDKKINKNIKSKGVAPAHGSEAGMRESDRNYREKKGPFHQGHSYSLLSTAKDSCRNT